MKFRASNIFPAALLMAVAALSYDQAGASISVIKYHFQWGIGDLLRNYDLYHHSFKDFIFYTSAFHLGNSEAEWRTVFYLLPLFLFCDGLGGLSIKAAHLFTITTSLGFLVLLYLWIKNIWDRQSALFAAFFLGFSSIFQEFARSGSYDSYSLLLAVIWVWFLFRHHKSPSAASCLILGLLTGLTWYAYGILRCLTAMAIVQMFSLRQVPKAKWIGLFIAGMAALVVPGILIKFQIQHQFISHYHGPLHRLFFDRESVFDTARGDGVLIAKEILFNLNVLGHRLLGGNQMMEKVLRNTLHAPYWTPVLVIPLCAGIGYAFKNRREPSMRLLFLLSAVIYLLPCLLTSPNGYMEARRSVLYLIPSYALIGLGMKEIINRIKQVNHLWIKRILVLAAAALIGVNLVREQEFINKHIIHSKVRDTGILDFASKVRQRGYNGEGYYFEQTARVRGNVKRLSVNEFADEGDIFTAAVMENGRVTLRMRGRALESRMPAPFSHVYAAKSPLVPQEKFDQWCKDRGLKKKLLVVSPVREVAKNIAGFYRPPEPFKFYLIYK